MLIFSSYISYPLRKYFYEARVFLSDRITPSVPHSVLGPDASRAFDVTPLIPFPWTYVRPLRSLTRRSDVVKDRQLHPAARMRRVRVAVRERLHMWSYHAWHLNDRSVTVTLIDGVGAFRRRMCYEVDGPLIASLSPSPHCRLAHAAPSWTQGPRAKTPVGFSSILTLAPCHRAVNKYRCHVFPVYSISGRMLLCVRTYHPGFLGTLLYCTAAICWIRDVPIVTMGW
ncbi:hypothetical protein H4582DRAFT_1992082 [Lactarius indigo]|nr:hypothetical protein H4582DRAFT_1992082 [Lactarius indigo]